MVDLAKILAQTLTQGEPRKVYLAADGTPTSQAEVADTLCREFQLPPPKRISLAEAKIRMTPDTVKMLTGSKRVDASKTCAQLKIGLRYPDYLSGYRAIWRQESHAIKTLLGA